MKTITLTNSEVFQAALVGVMRTMNVLKHGRDDNYKRPHTVKRNDQWQSHITGAIGEMAVAKSLGRFWSGTVGRIDTADVQRYQVRATVYQNGKLALHDADKDDEIFILAVGGPVVVGLAGWIYGRDGKKPMYWQEPQRGRPCYMVPQDALEPMDTLLAD